MAITEDAIKLGLLRAKWANDEARRERMQKYLDFYYDKHETKYLDDLGEVKSYLSHELAKRITDADELKYTLAHIEQDNITQRVIDNYSIMFREPPVIQIEGSEKVQEDFETLLEDTMFLPMLRTVNPLTNLLYDVAVIPAIRDGALEWDIVTPDNAFVLQNENDPTKADAFFYRVGFMENSITYEPATQYHIWTADAKYSCDVVSGGGISNVVKLFDHGLGEIPVAMSRNYMPINTFWNPRHSALVDKNVQLDLQLTIANTIQNSKLPQKVRIGVDDEYNGRLGITLTEDIKRNEDGDAVGSVEYIEPPTDLKELKEMTEWRENTMLATYGLNSATFDSTQVSSGFELFLAMSKVIQKNTEERPFYRKFIKDCLYFGLWMLKDEGLSPSIDIKRSDIKIDFGELTMLQSPEERERSRALKVQAGTWSAVQSIMQDNPDLTRDEAIAKVKEIQEENKLTARTFDFGGDDDEFGGDE